MGRYCFHAFHWSSYVLVLKCWIGFELSGLGIVFSLVDVQFGHNEFNVLLRQLIHLRLTKSVVEYTSRFDEMVHSLLAHSISWDPAMFPSCYVDGLKDEIHVVVIVHNPKDFDTAISLTYIKKEAPKILKH